MHKRIALNGLALLGMLAGATAVADTQPGFYVGAGLGQATIEVDDTGFGDGFDAHDAAFKVFAGYNLNQYFAGELTYFDGGEADQSFGPGTAEIGTDGLTLSVLGRLPLGEVFSIFGRIGFASYDVGGNGRVDNRFIVSDSGSDEALSSYGIGGTFNLGPSFELRAEYEAINISDGDFSVLWVSGLFKF